MRRVTTAVVAASAAIDLLVGCTGSDDSAEPAPAEPSAEQTERPAPSATTEPEPDCLVGTWQLDTADYVAQATAYVTGLGVPIEGLTVDGGQQLDITADGYLNQSTDLVWSASVMGNPITVYDQSAGGGEWWLDEGAFSVGGWAWTVDPSTAPPPSGLPAGSPAPELPGFSLHDITVDDPECTTDTLILQGVGAPLSGVFVRFAG